MNRLTAGAVLLAALPTLLLAGCSGSDATEPSPDRQLDEVTVAEVMVDGLDGPTQFAEGPAGSLVVAQLAGGEGDATGQVVLVDPATDQQRVLLADLDKPTGVLWLDDTLWVMVRRGLVAAPWDGSDHQPGAVEVVLDDLPFNGRSQGTLTALPDGRFLYETTGALAGGEIVTGSGTLWAFDPATRTSTEVAVGAKNAYAHALLPDGRVLTTEIGDAADPPREELDVLPASVLDGDGPVDLGWPTCRDATVCDDVVRPLALFPTASTPTGVAAIGDQLYVALFVTGEVVRVTLGDWQPGDEPVEPERVVDGLAGPHTLLVRDDGSLWLSEHLTGRLLRLASDG